MHNFDVNISRPIWVFFSKEIHVTNVINKKRGLQNLKPSFNFYVKNTSF